MTPDAAEPARGRTRARLLEEALALHQEMPVFMGYFNSAREQFRAAGGVQCDLAKLDRAGVRSFVASVGTGSYFQTGVRQFHLAGPDEWLLQKQLEGIDRVASWIASCPRTQLVTRAGHLSTRRDADTIGVILHITGNNHTTSLSRSKFILQGA